MSGGKGGILGLAFYFSTAVVGRSCGNVGIAQRFPGAVGGRGKPASGFPLPSMPSIACHFRSAVRSCGFLKLEAGKELPLCFLHLDGGSGIGLTSGLPLEIIQGDIVPPKPGHAR